MTCRAKSPTALASLLLACSAIAGCTATKAVVITDDTPLRLAEPVTAKVAYDAAPAGQPENWVVLPNKVTIPAGKYVITRKSVVTTQPAK